MAQLKRKLAKYSRVALDTAVFGYRNLGGGCVIKVNAKAIKDEILKELERLPLDLQRRVLDFTRSLVIPFSQGVPGRQLLRFAGILTPQEADLMERTIREGCERVDPGEW